MIIGFQAPEILTRVLLSSIFFIADSVVRGNLIVWKLSSFCAGGALQERGSQHLDGKFLNLATEWVVLL